MEGGAVVASRRVNAENGISSALGNAVDDAGSPLNSTSLAVGMTGDDDAPNAPAAAAAFVGPDDGFAAVPPATTVVEFAEAVLDLMNSDCRSTGCRWNRGATSSTTWY